MFNSYSMTQMVASICNAMGVEPPKQADKSIPLVDEFVKSRMGVMSVDDVPVSDVLAKETEEIDEAEIIIDDIEEIEETKEEAGVGKALYPWRSIA